MHELPLLTLNFAENHPKEAAAVLQQLAVEDTASFLEKIPPELGSRLLDRLAPQYAGQCLSILNSQTSAALIQGMKTHSTLSMLRIIPEETTQSLLSLLTDDNKSLLLAGLAYPQNVVGSWMDSEIPPVTEKVLVVDIRKALRTKRKNVEYAPCVVKADGTIAGLLGLSRLAAAKGGTKISKLMDIHFQSIFDQDTLQSVAALTDWDRFDALPVKNRKGKYMGMLTQKNLLKGLSASMEGEIPQATDSILTECIHAYTSTLSWLVQAALATSTDSPLHPK